MAVGAKEVESNSLSIRTQASGELGTMPGIGENGTSDRYHDNFNDYNC